MRLIDADALNLKRGDFAITSNPEMNRFNRMFVDLFNKEIDKATTIDAVEVVRCKDCKNYLRDSLPIKTNDGGTRRMDACAKGFCCDMPE